MHMMQHKQEALWFYRFLSGIYDQYINPFFWTPEMREKALGLAQLDSPMLKTLDVGAGTGFTTEGVVQQVQAAQVVMLDQSPDQLARALSKIALRDCMKVLGDAEKLPFPTDHFDRYVSGGSIEYWPDPQRAIAEAYRVLKPSGIATIIGPVRPTDPAARLIADTMMLFPSEQEYLCWFEQAGFTDIRVGYIAPTWYVEDGHPYGLAIAGVKPEAGISPLPLPPQPSERVDEPLTAARAMMLGYRFAVGSAAGALFVPMALYQQLLRRFDGKNQP
ncbi:methyltransferase domain-containing protein [Anthocerotibacter panamensis]|uniref:methyltransferase domain-containing protein n=1 Tax=Anthocerotibacter panamensis TaxID=2857077 RepID=UPI001C4067FE|nr:methyltransferase domain-containing protein [Anthocerotibacter panamensis]